MKLFQPIARGLYLLSLLSILATAASAQTTKYFWTIEIGQKHQIVCLHPVEPKMQQKGRVCRVTYGKDGKIELIEYLSAGKLSNDVGPGAAMIKVEYQGDFERRSFLNKFGRSIEANGGFNAERFKMDNETHRGSVFFYDEFGNPTTNNAGVARYQWELDNNGNVVKEYGLDLDGERTADNSGIYEVRYKLDDKGRRTEVRNIGKDGQLVLNSDGVAIERFKWNDNFNIIEAENFGPDELPLGRRSAAKLELKWDDRDDRTEVRIYDDNGKLLRITRESFDDRGNTLEKDQYEEEGKLLSEGICRTTYRYDDANRLLEVDEYDKDGKLLNDDGESAQEILNYDANGNLIEKRFNNSDGKLTLDKSTGYAIKRFVYDAKGHSIEDRYFDGDQKPIMIKAGYAIERRKYSDLGDQTESLYFDRDDHPVDAPPGVQRVVWTYNDAGKTLDVKRYNAKGVLVNLDSLRAHPTVSDVAATVTGTTGLLKSKEGGYQFKYNTSLWEISREQLSEKADFGLVHKSSDAFGMIFHHEDDESPADVLKAVLSDLESSMTNVSLVRKEYKTVNNHDMLFAHVQADLKDGTWEWQMYIAKTKKGHITIMCGSPKKSFDRLEPELIEFLNGMAVTE